MYPVTITNPEEAEEGMHHHRHTAVFLPVKNTATTAIRVLFENILLHRLSNCYNQKRFFDLKCIKSAWRPGSARAHRESLQGSPDPLAGFKGATSRQERMENGCQEKDKRGRERRDQPSDRILDPPLTRDTLPPLSFVWMNF